MLPVFLALLAADTRAADLAALTKGVTTVPRPGLPGEVALLQPNAVAFVLGKTDSGDRAVMAGVRFGQGRMVAIAHDGYLHPNPDGKTVMTNAVRWAGGGGFPDVGVFSDDGEKLALSLGLQAKRLRDGETGGQVLLLTSHADPVKVRDWVSRGGGVVAFCCPWGWAQVNPGKSLATDLSLNRILQPAGLSFADGYTEDARPTPSVEASDGVNAALALDQLATYPEGSGLVADAVRSLAPGNAYADRVKAVVAANRKNPVPTEANPIGLSQPYDRLAIVLDPISRGVAPSAADFPGPVPTEARRIKMAATIDTAVPQWHTFGAYAAPGEAITIRIPHALLAASPRLRIGLHTDENWNLEKWARHPSISRSQPIVDETTAFASPFGGLIALELDRPVPGTQRIELENVVPSARYTLGQTTPEEWKRQQSYLAPWAEIASKHLILTVPRNAILKLDDPKPVAQLWDELLEDYGKLDTRGTFARPERIVADRQISAGYMHSGYPIMTHLDAVDLSLSAERLRKEGSWGHFHELGHNRQLPAWTFEGTGEVTNNLYTLYGMQKIAGQTIWDRVGKEKGLEKVREYRKRGAKFSEWQSDPFLALTMYIQLLDAFGWEALTDVWASYQKPGSVEPKTEMEKRDQWMIRYSRRVNRNLGPFFQAWGVPTSDAARKEIADLPAWMPEGF